MVAKAQIAGRPSLLQFCLEGLLCGKDHFASVSSDDAEWVVERLAWHKSLECAAHVNDWSVQKCPLLERVFRECCVQNALRVERYRRQIEVLFPLFQTAGIRFMPYKGPFWGIQMYPEYNWRHVGDIDLLMPQDDARKCGEILKREGYIPEIMGTSEDNDFARRGAITYHPGPNLPGNVWVQVHWQLLSSPRFVSQSFVTLEDFFRDTHRASWGHCDFKTTDSTMMLLYMLLHATCQHQFDRFVLILDAVRLLQKSSIDWIRLQQLVTERDCGIPVYYGLAFIEKFYPLPAEATNLKETITVGIEARFATSFLTTNSILLADSRRGVFRRKLFRLAMSITKKR